MKKIIFTIVCLFSFISISKAELISNESIAVRLDNYLVPTYWGVSGSSTKSVSLKLNFEDPYTFEEIGAQYLVLSICSNASIDEWQLTNASKNNSWFDEFFEVYDTKKRCTTDGGFQGTMKYAQFLIGKYQIVDGLGVQVASNLHMKNVLSYSVQYSFKKAYLSTDDYLASFANDKIGDSIDDTNNKLDDTNSKLDEAEKTRKGILGVIQNVLSGIINLPSLIWEKLKSGFESVVNGLKSVGEFIVNGLVSLGEFIIEGIKSLFIPEDDFFSNYFSELYDFFTDKFGILMYPLDLLIKIVRRFLSLESGRQLITVPDIAIGDFGILIHGFSFYLDEYWHQEPYSYIYGIYKIFVNSLCVIYLVNLAKKKYDEVIKHK